MSGEAARPTRTELDALAKTLDTAHSVYLTARAQADACFASWEQEGWEALLAARKVAFGAWMDAQRVWLDACRAYHGLPDGPHAQPEQQQAQRAETGYPEAGYQTLAEGLRRLAAGRKALPAPLTYEQSQARWRAHMAEATRLQESLLAAPLEQVEGIRQQVHAELRECQRLTDLEQALLGEVRW